MSFFEEFTDMMAHTIQVHNHASYNQAGDKVPGVVEEVQCAIEQQAQEVIDVNGNTVVSNTTIYCARTANVRPESLITLPEGFHPRELLPIKQIMRMSDDEGPSHLVVLV